MNDDAMYAAQAETWGSQYETVPSGQDGKPDDSGGSMEGGRLEMAFVCVMLGILSAMIILGLGLFAYLAWTTVPKWILAFIGLGGASGLGLWFYHGRP